MIEKLAHIYRSAVIGVLMAGFLTHLLLPLSGQAKKTSFTRWLSHNVVETGDENEFKVRDTIRKLPDQTGDFSLLLKEASQLIANHKDVFRLSSHNQNRKSDHQIASWLIEQWNVYQHQNSMMNAFLSETGKVFIKWMDTGNGWGSIFSSNTHSPDTLSRLLGNQTSIRVSVSILSPLAFGISINAP